MPSQNLNFNRIVSGWSETCLEALLCGSFKKLIFSYQKPWLLCSRLTQPVTRIRSLLLFNIELDLFKQLFSLSLHCCIHWFILCYVWNPCTWKTLCVHLAFWCFYLNLKSLCTADLIKSPIGVFNLFCHDYLFRISVSNFSQSLDT